MYCYKCGNSIPDEAIFCPICGESQPSRSVKGIEPNQAPSLINTTQEKCDIGGCMAPAKHKCKYCGKLFCIKHIASPTTINAYGGQISWICVGCAEFQYKKWRKSYRIWGRICLACIVTILIGIILEISLPRNYADYGFFVWIGGVIVLFIVFWGWFICFAMYKGFQFVIKGNFPDLKI